jgi:hypothetical protein
LTDEDDDVLTSATPKDNFVASAGSGTNAASPIR